MSATKQGAPGKEHEAASTERTSLSYHDQATLHRRAAAVANELARIEDVLRGTTLEWMRQASREDRQTVVADLRLRDEAGFALEFNLRAQPLPGGAR